MVDEIYLELLQGYKILIVEDEPDSLEVATMLLEMSGAEVFSAANGQEGVALARQHQPTLILSDLSMPVMSGWEMIHLLKGDPNTANIPVIALTAHAMTGDRERVLAAGFHNYLSKPLSPSTFAHDLHKLVTIVPDNASYNHGTS